VTTPGFFGWLVRGRRPRDTAGIDQLVVQQLRSLGADLTQPRHVRHFLYFELEGQARAAAEEIELADYNVSVTSPDEQVPRWTVIADAYRVIGADTVPGFRAWFEDVAAKRNGDYDGWEPASKP